MEVKTFEITLPSCGVEMFKACELSVQPAKVQAVRVTSYAVKGCKPVRMPATKRTNGLCLCTVVGKKYNGLCTYVGLKIAAQQLI